MSERSINELSLNSITISNSNYSNSKGFTAQSNTLQTNNAGVLLVNGVPISSGGGGGVEDILGGDGIDSEETSTGVFTITNTGVLALTEGSNITITGTNGNLTINSTGGGGGVDSVTAGTGISVTETPSGSGTFEIENIGVLSLTAGDGINLDFTTGDITVSSTVDPADYYTIDNADATFQTLASMASYSTTVQSNGLYQPIGSYQTTAAMASYSTTTEANALYNPIVTTTINTVPTSANAQANGSINLFLNPAVIPNGGTYIYNINCYINSFDSAGDIGPYIISCDIFCVTRNALNQTVVVGNQYFSTGSNPVQSLPIALTGICNLLDGMAIYFDVTNVVLASGGTQFNIQNKFADTISTFALTKLN